MKLNEVFNQGAPITWQYMEESGGEATFEVNGKPYYFSYTMFDRDEELPDRVDVEFGMKGAGTEKGIHTTTGSGDQFIVFSTVLQAAKEALTKYPTNCITMSTSEPKRVPLYTQLIRKLLPTWKIESTQSSIIAYRA